MVNEVRQLLMSLPGVLQVAFIKTDHIGPIRKTEERNQKAQIIQLVNLGFQQVLEKRNIFVFLKDTSFRPPPTPTIYLVEELSKNHTRRRNCLEIDEKRYHIVGEEVLASKQKYYERHIFFGNGFVLFPDRRKGEKRLPSYFLIPPIRFPELEEEQERLGIANIISISPSTDTDECLRDLYSFPKDPDLATIMIGFDKV
jgi:hypothetical protein